MALNPTPVDATIKPAPTFTQELERAERDLIAALYSIWRLQGKRKKIVTEKRQ